MELLLNDILHLSQEEINNSKIEFNMKAGSGGQPFLDIWLKHSEEEKANGTCKDCSYWGWYGKQRNFHSGQWFFLITHNQQVNPINEIIFIHKCQEN
ncbi:hypothetical protein [uncultured Catenibacterium sp.]|uniref:hypothetical protein n=1 Tax=uncultured Catenibacterium sp. TaxID=286142 RepID=UPI0025D4DCF9|nr:hypothetical protein [uncultured Catenibacterium sp.]